MQPQGWSWAVPGRAEGNGVGHAWVSPTCHKRAQGVSLGQRWPLGDPDPTSLAREEAAGSLGGWGGMGTRRGEWMGREGDAGTARETLVGKAWLGLWGAFHPQWFREKLNLSPCPSPWYFKGLISRGFLFPVLPCSVQKPPHINGINHPGGDWLLCVPSPARVTVPDTEPVPSAQGETINTLLLPKYHSSSAEPARGVEKKSPFNYI